MNSATQRRLALATGLLGLGLFLGWEWFALKTYICKDNAPPAWDQADHLSDAWDYRQALKQRHWSVLWTLSPKPGMPPFPPLYALEIMGAYSSPKPAQAALMVNWFFLTLLCLSIFGIAWEFRPDLTALAAALIFAGAPAVQDLFLNQLMDIAVAALVAAAYWALIRSQKFARWIESLAFGLICALGMLHKWSFFAYLLPALWIAWRALREDKRRLKVLAALTIALTGFAPWYLAQGPFLLPKLVQASADQSIAFWKNGQLFFYFRDSLNGLGLPFFLLGWLSLLAPRHRRRWDSARLLPAWLVSAYLFWTIVPNRQMRFLLPGLPALAVDAASAWPGILVWPLAGFQVLSAANFPAGFIPAASIATPFGENAALWPSRPPAAADWKIADILKVMDKLRDRRQTFANATLVANAPEFNGPTFAWQDKALGLDGVQMRAVNQRLCELSQFVILKEGSLGSASVIAGLPEAAAQIENPRGWFKRAFAQVRSWPLPDGSQAVLFRQRRLAYAPFGGQVFRFQYYRSGPLTAENLRINLGAWDAREGYYPCVKVWAPRILFRGLTLTHVALELDDAVVIPVKNAPGAKAWDDVRFLRLGRLKILSAELSADGLRQFLENRVKNLDLSSLTMDKNTLSLAGQFSFIPVAAQAQIILSRAPRSLRFALLQMRVANVSIPLAWIEHLVPLSFSFEPNPETPFAIDVGATAIRGGRLTVGVNRVPGT